MPNRFKIETVQDIVNIVNKDNKKELLTDFENLFNKICKLKKENKESYLKVISLVFIDDKKGTIKVIVNK